MPAGWDPSRSAASDRNPWLVAVIVSIATFMVVLDTAIANVSLRYIAGSLAASVDESTWVVTTYLIANAVVLPASGWLSNVIGRKRFYMVCVAVFTVSSLFCGLAPSLSTLIFFRILQGLGGGGMPTSEQAILADTFPPQRRGQAFALYGVAVIVAPTVGPTIGGWITDNFSWHWIFFINVPIGLISLALVRWFVDQPVHKAKREKPDRHIDKENPVPGEIVGDPSADRRPHRRRDNDGNAIKRKSLAASVRRKSIGKNGLFAGRHAAAAESLQDTKENQGAKARSKAAKQRADGEQGNADHIEALASDDIGQPAARRQNHRIGDQIGGDHPGAFVDAGGETAGDVT